MPIPIRNEVDNGTGRSRETSTGKPARVDERGRESINFFSELKRHNFEKTLTPDSIHVSMNP
jgi:hypothetical protein